MHPLVRDLYKRVLIVGRDYPTGLPHVKTTWKRAMGNPQNCPSCYNNNNNNNSIGNDVAYDQKQKQQRCNEEIIFAVQKGRNMVKEMMGIIQLKKYRSMNQRYGGGGGGGGTGDIATNSSAVDPSSPCSASSDAAAEQDELQRARKLLLRTNRTAAGLIGTIGGRVSCKRYDGRTK